MGNLKQSVERKKKKVTDANKELFEKDVSLAEEGNEGNKLDMKKRKKMKSNNVVASKESDVKKKEGNEENKLDMKKRKKLKNKNVVASKESDMKKSGWVYFDFSPDVVHGEEDEGNEENKLDLKKRKKLKSSSVVASKESDLKKTGQIEVEDEDEKKRKKIGKRKRKSELENAAGRGNLHELGNKVEDSFEKQSDKPKKSKKKKRQNDTSNDIENIQEKREESDQDEVYCISSGDEDCSKGMQKWLVEYHQSRPGLKVLQEQIDDFITAHEEKLEQERKEKEALAAGDGWTVVVHHKGRKKTVDPESGIAVGSAAPVPAEYQTTKKKNKEVGVNFYRFQKRDAQRKEQLALLSKFEQDKKRIQQLRAARRFQPY